MEATRVKHPAKYNDKLLPVFADICRRYSVRHILDPFAGTGKIFDLWGEPYCIDAFISAVEIEPDWAHSHEMTAQGDARDLRYKDCTFDAIITSPTYGNRMADHHEARDASRRNTYRHALGKPLQPGNSGAMQWGYEYRLLHIQAWREAWRVLIPGGIFVLNMKDHVRAGRVVAVTDWHARTLQAQGFELVEHHRVECPGNRYGANNRARVTTESVIVFRKPAAK